MLDGLGKFLKYHCVMWKKEKKHTIKNTQNILKIVPGALLKREIHGKTTCQFLDLWFSVQGSLSIHLSFLCNG